MNVSALVLESGINICKRYIPAHSDVASLCKHINMKTEIEYVAYHRVKRVFLPITDIESENPEDIEVYEFEGQNFKLIAK